VSNVDVTRTNTRICCTQWAKRGNGSLCHHNLRDISAGKLYWHIPSHPCHAYNHCSLTGQATCFTELSYQGRSLYCRVSWESGHTDNARTSSLYCRVL
jgi:hypothetical protein